MPFYQLCLTYLLGLGLGESELPRLPTRVDVLAVVLRTVVGELGLLDWDVSVSAEWEGATFFPGILSLLGSSGRELLASSADLSGLDY